MDNTIVKVIKNKRIQGSILVLSIMIILILSVIGLAILKTQESSGETIAQEVLGTRALMAARSGLESNLYALFPLRAESGDCENTSLTFDTPGLQSCSVNVTCELYANVNNISYYRVQSTGECGTGEIETNSTNVVLSSRTIQVEARSIERDED